MALDAKVFLLSPSMSVDLVLKLGMVSIHLGIIPWTGRQRRLKLASMSSFGISRGVTTLLIRGKMTNYGTIGNMILDSNALSEILSSCFTVSDFRYWITKPDFVFDPTKPLTWDDFEEEEFCVLPFTYSTANDDPLVIMDEPAKTFTTICDVPDRPQGHHIIYGEWGRGPGTYERFHGCIDVAFEGTPSPTSSAAPSPPPVTQAPTTSAAPSENLNGCCSQSFKSCDASYNGEDKETCESHGDSTGWLRKGAPTDNCLARWSGCNSAANTCCPGLTCSQISSSYSQCQYLPDAVPTP
eukprot:CAMPEP_0172463458 /NCGR_PEP_ID=MMETSP1065-20121228/47262_1 /TAXON_ID=265537 /ORGANISM="Amphiprora paludosa, Strain CCMP125" /LENGTH=296 /DNA_ID=CAMNT_0013219409 /DNA_START=390 /DNA_END=1277 /DNA_ORIENTATION=+